MLRLPSWSGNGSGMGAVTGLHSIWSTLFSMRVFQISRSLNLFRAVSSFLLMPSQDFCNEVIAEPMAETAEWIGPRLLDGLAGMKAGDVGVNSVDGVTTACVVGVAGAAACRVGVGCRRMVDGFGRLMLGREAGGESS